MRGCILVVVEVAVEAVVGRCRQQKKTQRHLAAGQMPVWVEQTVGGQWYVPTNCLSLVGVMVVAVVGGVVFRAMMLRWNRECKRGVMCTQVERCLQ